MRGEQVGPIGSPMTRKHKNRKLQIDFGSKGALGEVEAKLLLTNYFDRQSTFLNT